MRNTLMERHHGIADSAKVLLLRYKREGRKTKGSLVHSFLLVSLPPTFLPSLFLYWNRFVQHKNFVNFF